MLLIYVVVFNNVNVLVRFYIVDDGCFIVKFGFFVGVGVLCIISIVFGFNLVNE